MNDPKWLRAPTIFAAFPGRRAHGSPSSPPRTSCGCCSARDLSSTEAPFASPPRRPTRRRSPEMALTMSAPLVGMPVPDVYSAELSEFVFAAGVKLLHSMQARPHVSLDDRLRAAQIRARHGGRQQVLRHDGSAIWASWMPQGAIVVIVADHGMKDKHLASGEPDVIYLQDVLDDELRRGQDQGHPAHHRSLCRASRRAGLLRNRLRHMGPPSRDVMALHQEQPGIDVVLDARRGLRALRTAGRPHGRHRRRFRWSRRHQGDRHEPVQA